MLGGRYRVAGELDAGGQGRVLAAIDTWCADRPVVLKQVPLTDHAQARREFEALASLRHEALPVAVDLVLDGGHAYLVETRIEGEPLLEWARWRDARELLATLASAAHALAHLHARGLVHMDPSPRNLLVRPGPPPSAALVDLGLSRRAGECGAAGSPGFVAPEVMAGEPATAAADVYSLAASAIIALSGAELGWRLPDPAIVEQAEARQLLAECLSEAPASRPSALELARRCVELGGGDPRAAFAPHTELPLCGRGRELQLFDAWLAEGGATLRIGGAPNSGKSAFLQAAAGRARVAGFTVLAAGGGDPRALEVLLAQAAAVAPEGSAMLGELGAELADIVSHTRLPPAGGWLPSAKDKGLLLVLALDALAREVPLLVLLDDAGDPASDLAAAVAIWRRRPPQPGPRVLMAGGGETAELTLGPIDRDGVRELLAAAFAEERPELEAERLLTLCGGLPGRLVEALATIARRRIGVLELTGAEILEPPTRGLPPSLVPLALSPNSVGGPAVRRLAAQEPEGEASLRAAVADGRILVENTGGSPSYRVPESVRRATRVGDTATGHRRLAQALEDSGLSLAAAPAWARAGEPARSAALVEEHAQGRPDEVLRAAAALAEVGATSLLSPAAVERWARLASEAAELDSCVAAAGALEALGRGTLGRALVAAAQVKLGRYGDALVTLADADGNPGVIAVRARALLFSGRAREAGEVARVAWQSAAGRARAELLEVLGHSALEAGDVETARAVLERACAEAEHSDEPATVTRAQHALAVVLQKCGERRRALELYRASLETADSSARAVRTLNLATLLQDMGQLAEARDLYEKVLSRAMALANAREQARAGVNLANLQVQLGELGAAKALAQRTLELCAAGGLDHAAVMAALVLGEAHLERDELEPAAGALSRAAELLDRVQDRAARAELELLSARLATAHGDAAVAERHLASVEAGAAGHLQRQLCYWRARLAASLPGPDAGVVAANAEEAARLAREAEDRELLWRALAVLAHAQAGDELSARTREEAAAELDGFLAGLPEPRRADYLACRSRRELAAWVRRPPSSGCGPLPLPGRAYRRLLAINRRLAREREVQPLLELIVDGAIELLGAERGFLILHEHEGVRVAVARNFDRRSLEDGRQRISRSIAAEVLGLGEPVLTTNAQQDERFAGISSVAALKVRSVICVPLRGMARGDDPLIGALYLDHRFQERAFTELDVELCGSFADQAAIAIENARLFEQNREQERRLSSQNERLARLNAQLQREAAAFAAEAEAALRRLREEGPTLGVGRGFERIVGRSDRLRDALRLVDRFADTDVPVVVHGESGTGKELVARAVHERSRRSHKPFVCINCGAIPEALIESELFGYKKGAFTGAVRDKPGLLAAAEGGTLFLDEIAAMPLSMQVKLLRVLQEREYRPVGATSDVRADVRFVGAAARRLEDLVGDGTFREDLYYRLATVEIRIPPLRERREDIPLLVDHFCRQCAGEPADARFSQDAVARLMGHDWPGNVRELENEVRRALALADGRVRTEDLSERFQAARAAGTATLAEVNRGSLKEVLEGFEREVLLATLKRTGWNVRQAAKELGLSRAAFYTRLSRFGITREAGVS